MKNPGTKTGLNGGFTILELLIVSLIMMIVVVGALSMYVKGNKTTADQQQFSRIQQDVRASMYYLARDIRMAGTGLSANFLGSALEGVDNEDQDGSVRPDRIKIMGNIEIPFSLTIQSTNGSGTQAVLDDSSLEQYPYPDDFYVGRIVLILPSPGSNCVGAAVREITNVVHNPDGTNEKIDFHSHHHHDEDDDDEDDGGDDVINPPGGLRDVCPDEDYTGGSILFCDIREFWLDVTGNAPGLTAGQDGYIGGGTGGVLYLTANNVHSPLAQNIENVQFQYNGNFDGDTEGTLDGFADWNDAWTPAQVAAIRQIKIWVLGQTPDRFVSIPVLASRDTDLYRRPAIANSPEAASDDGHKRFLLESSSNIRNLSLDIYNRVQR